MSALLYSCVVTGALHPVPYSDLILDSEYLVTWYVMFCHDKQHRKGLVSQLLLLSCAGRVKEADEADDAWKRISALCRVPAQVTPQTFCVSVATHTIRLGLVGSVDLSSPRFALGRMFKRQGYYYRYLLICSPPLDVNIYRPSPVVASGSKYPVLTSYLRLLIPVS